MVEAKIRLNYIEIFSCQNSNVSKMQVHIYTFAAKIFEIVSER